MNLISVFNYLTEQDAAGNYVNGGATYNLNTHEFNPKSGYIVSLIGFEKVVEIPKNLNEWQTVITQYLGKRGVFDALAEQENVYLGLWIDGDRLCIDLSERIDCLGTAMSKGSERKQKAIWDANQGKVIYLYKKVSNDPDILTDKKY